jgi:hypothetical protein
VLPPLAKDATTNERDPDYAVTVVGLFFYVVLSPAFSCCSTSSRSTFGWASVRECHPTEKDPRPGPYNFQRKEASALNLWKRYVARRHRKQHERIEAERARQKALAGQDVEEAVRNVAQGSASAQQGTYGHGT